MSKELATYNDFTFQLAELDKIQDTCKKLMATKHYQAMGEAGIHAIMAKAKALGIHPFEALNGGFNCINGKVGMSTEMMAALIRKRGHSITKDPKSTNECCILHGKRADNGDTWTCTFSKEDAVAAGLWNSATWKKYPSVMLYNRCMSQLFRQLFPDLSMGAGYVEDELKEITKTGDYAASLPTAEVEYTEIKAMDVKKVLHMDVDKLNSMLLQCPSETKQVVDSRLKKLNITDYKDIPIDMFPKIEQFCLDEIAKHKALQAPKQEIHSMDELAQEESNDDGIQ